MESAMYLGLDIGGTNLKGAIFDKMGNEILQRNCSTSCHDNIVGFTESLFAFIDKIRTEQDFESIGAGVPGYVDRGGKVLVSPNIPALTNFKLYSILQERYQMPVAVDNDANVGALAELHYGRGRESGSFLYVTLGTGIGGAIILDGKLIRGQRGGAGEIGQMIIDCHHGNDFMPQYRHGTMEIFGGRASIIELMKTILDNHPDSILNDKEDLDVKDISMAVKLKDEAARNCFRTLGYYLAIGICSAINLLDISMVILGGGISMATTFLYREIEDNVKLRALPPLAERFELRRAKFTRQSGIIGAGVLARDHAGK